MVPSGWKISTLGQLGHWSGGGTPSKSILEYWTNGTIPWVSPKDMGSTRIFNAEDYITVNAVKNSSTKLYPSGSILVVTRSGILKRKVPVAVAMTPVSVNQDIKVLQPNDLISTEFIANVMWCYNDTILARCAKDGTTVESIDTDSLLNFPIKLPPLNEQRQIAQVLSEWEKAILVTEQLLKNSLQQKKALMQQLLTGKKRLLDENGVNFSEGWNEYLLGNLGNTFTGLTGKTKDDFGSGVPYITYMNIFKNSRIDINQVDYVVVKEDENQNSVRYGDIFFTTSSETADEVGMSSVLLEEVERLYLNSFCFGFRLNNFKVLLPQFAAYILRSSNIRKQISILGQGATRYNLSKNQLMKLILRLPTIAEQKKIAEVLYLADQEIETLQKKLDCLKQEKKALMQQLLTGKKRVKVAA
ncbi:restriction endonuclease subunit S [Acinetobacter baumannii]|uniref:restriction endonuclease subunit S n=1 Tax=Acinetobacter baumannii TaxID=470 RepID=UPI000F73A98F|nr:restriction endonuclease subunit S [Acinetobacter baumannii]MBJ9476394.1 restriction endonuclease subunit S [Acinetobacter baumannii]RSQ47366.1 restriction endonuclease subunit S [Acinetobacter baumannii]